MAERKSMRDRIKEQAQKSTTEGASYLNLPNKVHFFNPKDGEFELDIIPYENKDGDLEPYLRYKVHANIGAGDNKYVCPTSIGKPCPICDERKRMAKSASGDAEVIKALNAKDRVLIQLFDLLDKKLADTIQLWDASYHAFLKDLLKGIDTAENSTSSRKRSLPHAGFAELAGGQTLLVTMAEHEKIKKFYVATRIDAADRDDYEEAILDEVVDLSGVLKVLPYDELEAIFLELDPEEQGKMREKPEDKEPAKRSRGKAAEDDAPPARKRGAAKEEAAEEPPPSRRRGAAPEPKEEPAEAPPTRRRGAAEPKEEPETPAPSRRRGAATPEPEPEAPPTRSRRGAPEAKKDDRCWVDGGVFGVDCDTHLAEAPEPNCYDCPEATWTACKAAQDALNK